MLSLAWVTRVKCATGGRHKEKTNGKEEERIAYFMSRGPASTMQVSVELSSKGPDLLGA